MDDQTNDKIQSDVEEQNESSDNILPPEEPDTDISYTVKGFGLKNDDDTSSVPLAEK